MIRLLLGALLATALASGCMSEDRLNGVPDSFEEVDAGDVESLLLDVSVTPPLDSSAADGSPALRQSIDDPLELTGSGARLDISLKPAVNVSGQITGYEVTPWPSPAELPGANAPIDATVTLRRPGTRQSYTIRTHDMRVGTYTIDVVPADDYEIVVIPDSGLLPPIVLPVEITENPSQRLDVDVGVGSALYGHVVDLLGQAIPGVAVRARNDEGVVTSPVYSDEGGEYVLYVSEGTWTVTAEGPTPGRDPSIYSEPVLVDGSGARVTLKFGESTRAAVSGRVVDDSGNPVPQVLIRFTSDHLDAYPSGSARFEVETETTTTGTWDTQLLPGSYLMQSIPRPGVALTPQTRMVTVTVASGDLGASALPSFVAVTGSIVDLSRAAAVPLAGLQCTETGLSGYSYSIFADEFGDFEIALPREPVACVISPPGEKATELSMTRAFIDPAQETEKVLQIQVGQAISGTISLEGRPLAFASLQLSDFGDGVLRGLTFTDDRGFYTLRVTALPGSED